MKLDCLQKFLPEGSERNFTKGTVKKIVRNILTADDDSLASTYEAITSTSPSSFGPDTYIPKLAPRLASQYEKKDPGVLVALITMNFLTLNPGEAIYIPANGIHGGIPKLSIYD